MVLGTAVVGGVLGLGVGTNLDRTRQDSREWVTPVAVTPVAPLTGYAQGCVAAVRAGADWMALATRAVASDDLSDISRAEVEDMINRLASLTPGLPPEIQPETRLLVEPLVSLRGLLLTGAGGTVDYSGGRDAVLRVVDGCGPYMPG